MTPSYPIYENLNQLTPFPIPLFFRFLAKVRNVHCLNELPWGGFQGAENQLKVAQIYAENIEPKKQYLK